MSRELTAVKKVVGRKQTRRAVSDGNAGKVYLACDADPWLTQPVLESCRDAQIPCDTQYSMKHLGKACGIEVGTAAAAILAK